MKKQSPNRFKHCVKRARERYGIKLTYKDWSETLPSLIKGGTFSRPAREEEVSSKLRKGCSKYYVVDMGTYKELEVIVVLDIYTDEIQTFLPNKSSFLKIEDLTNFN